MTEAKYHAAVKELKKQLILDAVEQTQGKLCRRGAHSGRASELFAPVDP